MSINKTTSKLLLYISKTLRNGEHPIVIRLIKNRKPKYISLGYSTTVDLWDEKARELIKGYNNFKQINLIISKKKNEIDDIILNFENEKKPYSLELIESKFLSTAKQITVFDYCGEHIKRLENSKKVGNAAVFKDLLRNLKKYRKEKDLLFSDLTPSFLKRYEEDFQSRDVKETSISVYMRTLRSLFNKAMTDGFAKEESYPFKDYKISALNSKTRKRSIPESDLLKIKKFDCEDISSLIHAKNYFLFSFYCMGMNFSDMAKLKWSDIIDDRIQYTRSKTGRFYNIKCESNVKLILDFYSKNNENTNDYVFPILNDNIHKTPQSVLDRIKKVTKKINKDLKDIARTENIPNPSSITLYVARHSWAMIQKKLGRSTGLIGQGLGHRDEKTTQIYLNDFANSELDEINKNLI